MSDRVRTGLSWCRASSGIALAVVARFGGETNALAVLVNKLKLSLNLIKVVE